MTLELALSGTALSVAVGMAACLWRFAYRQGQLELKVNTMWDFMIRRGQTEMADRGWGRLESPLVITANGLEIVMPFLNLFLPLYIDMVKRKLSERDMYVELEHKMGDFIVERICIPNNITRGACLVMIMKACEQEASHA